MKQKGSKINHGDLVLSRQVIEDLQTLFPSIHPFASLFITNFLQTLTVERSELMNGIISHLKGRLAPELKAFHASALKGLT